MKQNDLLPLSHLERGRYTNEDGVTKDTVAIICDCGDPDCTNTRVYFVDQKFEAILRRGNGPKRFLAHFLTIARKEGVIKECQDQTVALTAALLELTPDEYLLHAKIRGIAGRIDKVERALSELVGALISIELDVKSMDPHPDPELDKFDIQELIDNAPEDLKDVLRALHKLNNSMSGDEDDDL